MDGPNGDRPQSHQANHANNNLRGWRAEEENGDRRCRAGRRACLLLREQRVVGRTCGCARSATAR